MAPGYLLDVPVEAVDAHRFAELLRADRMASEADRFDQQRSAAHEGSRPASTLSSAHRARLDHLPTLLERLPLHEALRGSYVLALCRSGRQADALAHLDAVPSLADELGFGPGPGTRAALAAGDILRQDAALEAPVLVGEPVVASPASPAPAVTGPAWWGARPSRPRWAPRSRALSAGRWPRPPSPARPASARPAWWRRSSTR